MSGPDRLGEMAAFVAVIDAGGLAAGARAMGMTASAMSKLLARLEQRLGVRLVHRTTRRMALTVEGRRFHQRARDILAEVDHAESELQASGRQPKGLLRVSLSHGFGTLQVVPLLPAFATHHPGIELELIFADHHVDLLAEGIDVAVRVGSVRDESLVARKLATHERIVCAAPSYLQRHGTPRQPADLARHTCVRYAAASALNAWPFRGEGGKVERISVSGTIRSNNVDALYAAVLGGLAIGRMPDFIAGPELASGRLVPLLQDFALPEASPIHAVWPAQRQPSPRLRAFVDFLLERFQPVAPWQGLPAELLAAVPA